MATSGASERTNPRGMICVVSTVLAVLTLAVFARTLGDGFVNYDDNANVYENAFVTNGLTASGLAHAFTQGSVANWDPLTTISHMADCQVYGLNPAGHHLTNILLHTASVVLLFLVLQRMTGALWPSAFVAALFAIHPLRVESVAWVSERKDTLSGLFFMLTLWAYVKYVGEFKVQGSRFKVYYLLTLVLFALGLMSKAMLVTLPVILLLLDYWPLGRSSKSEAGEASVPLTSLIIEKLPLFALSLAACVVAVVAQQHASAVQSFAKVSFGLRSRTLSSCRHCISGRCFGPRGWPYFIPIRKMAWRWADWHWAWWFWLWFQSERIASGERRYLLWVGLVFDHADAGDWAGAIGPAGARGSLHLFAGDWIISCAGVAGRKLLSGLARAPAGFRRVRRVGNHRAQCGDGQANFILA